MSGDLSSFGQRLREIRTQKGLKQNDLAVSLNTSYQTVSHWEAGRSAPNFEVLCQLADLLEVSLDYLANRTDNPVTARLPKGDGSLRYGLCSNLTGCGRELFNGNPDEDIYCPFCGAKIVYFCPRCETPVKMKQQRNCTKCGQNLFKPKRTSAVVFDDDPFANGMPALPVDIDG